MTPCAKRMARARPCRGFLGRHSGVGWRDEALPRSAMRPRRAGGHACLSYRRARRRAVRSHPMYSWRVPAELPRPRMPGGGPDQRSWRTAHGGRACRTEPSSCQLLNGQRLPLRYTDINHHSIIMPRTSPHHAPAHAARRGRGACHALVSVVREMWRGNVGRGAEKGTRFV